MTSELKPCPFCGGKAKLYGGPDAQESYSVWCEGSHRLNGNFNKDETIAKWNTRAVPDVPELVPVANGVFAKGEMVGSVGLEGYEFKLTTDIRERHPVVRYDQAAALIAAKDGVQRAWQDIAKHHTGYENPSMAFRVLLERAEAAEAELAQIKAQGPVGADEIYVDVEGYEGLYEVSNTGNVRSKARNKILAKCLAGSGYQTAEIERLRKALKLIASETAGLDLHDARDISRAALSAKEPL